MVPCSFDESNHSLNAPEGMTDQECDPLCVWVGNAPIGSAGRQVPVVISCYKLTKYEQEEFQRTGRIWLWVFGETMPPVALSTNNPFKGIQG